MDNFGYKEGTDTKYAPWNREDDCEQSRKLTLAEKAQSAKALAEAIAKIEARFGK